jgi:hypothetical protein
MILPTHGEIAPQSREKADKFKEPGTIHTVSMLAASTCSSERGPEALRENADRRWAKRPMGTEPGLPGTFRGLHGPSRPLASDHSARMKGSVF